MKHYFLLLPLLTMILSNGYTQGGFNKGYIITLENDTVYGCIKDENINRKMINCSFRHAGSKETVDFAPGEILGYGFNDFGLFLSKLYINKDSTITGIYFYEVIFDGFINLYMIKEKGRDAFFIEMDYAFFRLDKSTKTVWDVEKNRNVTRVSSAYFGYLLYLFQDIPELRPSIEKTNLNAQSLISLAKTYHTLVDREEATYSIPYHPGRYKFSFMPFLGFRHNQFLHHHRDIETTRVNLVKSNNPEIGITIEAQLPKARIRPFMHASYERFNGETSAKYGPELNYSIYVYADYSQASLVLGTNFPLSTFLYPSFISAGIKVVHLFDYNIYQLFNQPIEEYKNLNLHNVRLNKEFGKAGLGCSAGYQYRRGINPWLGLALGAEVSFFGIKFGDETRYTTSAGVRLGLIINKATLCKNQVNHSGYEK